MRFLYNKKQAVVTERGTLEFVDKTLKVKQEALKENLKKFEIDGYKKLLFTIAEETKTKTEKKYFCFLNKNEFLLAVQELNFDIEVKAFYKFENEEMKELLKKLLALNEGESRVIIGNHTNNFNFLTARTILNVLFVNAELKAKGEKPYHQFKIKSKNGKIRKITAPHEDLKVALQSLNSMFQYVFDKKNADFQVAYKKGKSIVDNAKIHQDKKFIYNVDLKDFFPSCNKKLVKQYVDFFFKNSFNNEVVEEEFLNTILVDDALFIGSPISGTLANVIISRPVNYIKNITNGFGMEFSVYADDMTFSSDRFISKVFVENIFNAAFTQYNMDDFFKLNSKKSHGMTNIKRRITGVSINDKDELVTSRKFYRDIRTKLFKLSMGDSSINVQKLRGQIAFASMVDESGKFVRLLEKYSGIVDKLRLINPEKLEAMKEGGK
jgi:hypothetical protein